MKPKKHKASLSSILNLISEAGMLKRVVRSGWSVLGIKDAETVAEHSFRCALIGYVLARMEKVPPYKVLLMTLFNDLQEARLTDLHKMAQRYLNSQPAEEECFSEQIDTLPRQIKGELTNIHQEYRKQKTKESVIARDADILECLIQAKEYREHGFSEATKFMRKAPRFLTTDSAQGLWQLAKQIKLNDWWVKLSRFER